jgi:hypothetical protein
MDASIARRQLPNRESADLLVRLRPYCRTSMIMGCLLLLHAAFFTWQLAIPSPMIDFFTFWSVPHVLSAKPIANIYSPDHQREMASGIFAEAQSAGVSDTQQRATQAIAQLYGGRLDATGSPLLYAFIGLLSSGDYETDRRRFLSVSMLCLAASVMMLCRLLQFSALSTLLLLVFLSSNYSPVLSDFRVGNVNEIQLFAIALFVLFTARSSPLLAGLAIGTATMLKPTTSVVLAVGVVVGLADRDYRRLFRMLAGCLVSALASVIATEIYFGNPKMWIDFIKSLPHTLAGGLYPLEHGNFSLAELLFGGTSETAAAILVVLFVTLSGLVFASRRGSPAREEEHQRLVHSAFLAGGTGCALMLLSSPLAWLHYYLLLLPLSLYLIRPTPVGSAPASPKVENLRWLAFVPLLMFSSVIESMMQHSALAESIMVNGATILTSALALAQIWRRRFTTNRLIRT